MGNILPTRSHDHTFRNWAVGVAIVGSVLGLLVLTNNDNDKACNWPGTECYLYIESDPTGGVIVARSEKDAKLFGEAVADNDTIGVNRLRSSGAVWMEEPGTKVLFLHTTVTLRGVRLLSGPNTGTIAWVPFEWVHGAPPKASEKATPGPAPALSPGPVRSTPVPEPDADVSHVDPAYRSLVQNWFKRHPEFRGPALMADCAPCRDGRLPQGWDAENQHPYYAIGDFNHDGQKDLAVVSRRGDLIIFNGPLRSTGDATFIASINKDDCLFLKQGVLVVGPWASDFIAELRWDGSRYSLHN
jgi:hypothetical protein